MPWQGDLFDEAELEQALFDLEADLPEENQVIRARKHGTGFL